MIDFSTVFVGTAHAQAATPAAGTPVEPSPFAQLIPFILIIFVVYFFMIRPQSKRFREHQDMVKALKKGDRVVTGGGIIGKVVKAEEGNDTLEVEIAAGVNVEVSRQTISGKAASAPTKKASSGASTGKRKKAAPAAAQSSNETDGATN